MRSGVLHQASGGAHLILRIFERPSRTLPGTTQTKAWSNGELAVIRVAGGVLHDFRSNHLTLPDALLFIYTSKYVLLLLSLVIYGSNFDQWHHRRNVHVVFWSTIVALWSLFSLF